MSKTAILLTSYNRIQNTLACLSSIYQQKDYSENTYSIFLVIDGSTDGTEEAVRLQFPAVNIINGDGSLFWAGGMRLCYDTVFNTKENFDYYLLLNDDTVLYENAFSILEDDFKKTNNSDSIIVGSTKGENARINDFTYGGRILLNKYNSKSKIIIPDNVGPQLCHLGNANILRIPSTVLKKIGFLSTRFTHGIADFEYTLRAKKNGINSYSSSQYLGVCHIGDNQTKDWANSSKTLKERIEYLYSPKGLAYKEYLYYIKTYFPYYYPQAWSLLWVKTFFPIIWDKLKNKR